MEIHWKTEMKQDINICIFTTLVILAKKNSQVYLGINKKNVGRN